MAHLRTAELVQQYGIPEATWRWWRYRGERSALLQARQDRVLRRERRSGMGGGTKGRDWSRRRTVSTEAKQALADLADLADPQECVTLDAVEHFLSRFIAYPSDHARHAHTLWLAHTWRMDVWESTPRLAFMSAEKGSGKTRALEVSEYLVPRGVRVSQATTGYILAKISDEPPATLFYDEIDTVYGSRGRGNEDLPCAAKRGTPPWRNCRSRNVGQRHAGRAGLSGLLRGRARGTGQAPGNCRGSGRNHPHEEAQAH